jgi:hypothetical protein
VSFGRYGGGTPGIRSLKGILARGGIRRSDVNAVHWIVARNIALAVGLLVLMHLLVVLLYREWVKADVRRRALVPIRIRWQPLQSSRFYCSFSVVYEDWDGNVRHAWARTTWNRREIIWAGQWPAEDSSIRGRRD